MSEATEAPYGLPPYVLERLNEVFRGFPGVARVVLYGSRAKGTYRRGSNLDLCVEGETLEVTDLLKLDVEIDDLLLPWKVHLSLRHTVENPDLLAHIDRVGIPIYPGE